MAVEHDIYVCSKVYRENLVKTLGQTFKIISWYMYRKLQLRTKHKPLFFSVGGQCCSKVGIILV